MMKHRLLFLLLVQNHYRYPMVVIFDDFFRAGFRE
jgi:hypothetical protein